ncbi:MAG: hypothetical protein ABWX56_00230 [Mycetocola sp.]
MEPLQPRATVAAPVSALALAVGAAVCLGVGDAIGFVSATAEDVFVATWLLGWVLLAWAAIVGGGYAVLLGYRWFSHRHVASVEAALVATSLALTAVVMATHPLWGAGSALGG